MAKDVRQLTPEEKSARDRLRSKTVGAPAVHLSRQVEWNGEMYEVRAPSMILQQRIERIAMQKDGSQDNFKALFAAVINCVYVPGTDVLVFEAADEAGLGERSIKDVVGVFARALTELAKEASIEAAEKN